MFAIIHIFLFPFQGLCLITAGSNTTFERECPENLNCTEMYTKEKSGVNVTYHFCRDSDLPECDEKDEKDEGDDNNKADDSTESDENSDDSDEDSDESDENSHGNDRRKWRLARRGGRRGERPAGRMLKKGLSKLFQRKSLNLFAKKGKKIAKKIAAKLRRRCRPRKTTVAPSTASTTTTQPLP